MGKSDIFACMKKASKNRLTHQQAHLFPGDTLFAKIARAVCRAGTVPRKELYEAWEMARRVHRKFRGGRIVDLACGQGLLAHILLILDPTSESAVAADKQIPQNAEKMADVLSQSWPDLKARIEYRQTDLLSIPVMKDDIVVSAHACGRITDQVIDKAVEKKARLAVMPCCHDVKNCRTAGLDAWMDVSLAIDSVRALRLESAGYRIWLQAIPKDITPKNRLLIGEPLS